MYRKHIYLTGFMGSGKSSVGPRVAQALGFPFIDLDEEIQRLEGRTIDDIFQGGGEMYFRSLERQYLQNYIGNPQTVFALGGGTVTIEGLIQELRASGVLVYLKTDVDALVPRLRGHVHRPLLYGTERRIVGEAELHRKIAALLREREVYYHQADIVIDTSHKPLDAVVEDVLNALAEYLHKDEQRTIR